MKVYASQQGKLGEIDGFLGVQYVGPLCML